MPNGCRDTQDTQRVVPESRDTTIDQLDKAIGKVGGTRPTRRVTDSCECVVFGEMTDQLLDEQGVARRSGVYLLRQRDALRIELVAGRTLDQLRHGGIVDAVNG